MKERRFTTVPVTDFSITQKVRSALIEAGHPDLVVEQIAGNFKELEERVELLGRDIRLLQKAERERLTDTGVIRIIEARTGKEAIDWVKWGQRTALVTALGVLVKFAWNGVMR